MAEACRGTSRGDADAAIRSQYAKVAANASGHFPYPVGRPSAERLGYSRAALDAVPAEVLDRFVGVGNPFPLCGELEGKRVLDVGCGCGVDSFVAAGFVGPTGTVVGIDLSSEMVDVARRAVATRPSLSLQFREASALDLPFAEAAFDVVISNGVLNLVPDKDRAFEELARVLRRGGVLAVADLLAVDEIPAEVRSDPHAWAT